MNTTIKRSIRRRLFRWYDRNGRELPWRTRSGRPNPYHTLVSETMLQQTQAGTVVPYFHRFLEKFPKISDLAEADEQAVLRAWQGLGYYRRARHLHQTAKAIMSEHNGVVPDQAETLIKLPGIGRYSAGAIASIAFDRRSAILDGNVARVLARVLAISESIDQPKTRATLWSVAEQLVQGTRPGDFNQSLMDLGALICSAKSPKCLMCPLMTICQGRAIGMADQLPIRSAKKKPIAVTHHIMAIRKASKFLFEERPERGLWAGMWQLPTFEEISEDSIGFKSRIEDQLGLTIDSSEEITKFSHQTTHRTIHLVLHEAACIAGRRPRDMQWRRLDDLNDLPLAVPQQKAVKYLIEHQKKQRD